MLQAIVIKVAIKTLIIGCFFNLFCFIKNALQLTPYVIFKKKKNHANFVFGKCQYFLSETVAVKSSPQFNEHCRR